MTASRYVSIALAFSLGGLPFGGWWCDMLTRRFGQRWGRRLPFLFASTVAVTAYLLCPFLQTGLGVAVACCVCSICDRQRRACRLGDRPGYRWDSRRVHTGVEQYVG